MLLTALLLTAAADILPPGHRDLECYHRVEGIEAAPGKRWALYPEGTSFDGLEWLEPEDGALEFRFYDASSPRLWVIPEALVEGFDERVLAGPGEACVERCAEAPGPGCALCEAAPEAYFEALDIARSAEPLYMCDAVPESSELIARVLLSRVSGVEAGWIRTELSVVDRTEADAFAEKQAEREAREVERLAWIEAQREAKLKEALKLIGLSALLVGVGLALRWQARRLGGR
ncbi:MAG: hypothetical protein H6741_32140 [Alphaproteobacteria bacterium]|nr:hypothetical protein [Alphaproteobacteria bacterium]MCB9797364.1 hypothetical protein [Alphaproteobacteria bacterium]